MESVIQPPAQYPDLFPVLNVLVSTPVFGLVWLWSIKSGVEVGWAIVGLGGGNPGTVRTGTSSHLTSSSSAVNFANATSPEISHLNLPCQGDSRSQLHGRDPPLSPLSSFNRKIGSPPAVLGPHRPGVRERTWSSVSTNSHARVRGNIPVGPGWDRPFNSEGVERVEDGADALVRGLGLTLGSSGQAESFSDKRRRRVQSFGMPNVRKRAPNLPGNVEALPPPSD